MLGVRFILNICFYCALLRATKIGLFYPTDERNLASIDYTLQSILNYGLIAGILAYVFLSNNYRKILDLGSNVWTILILGICLLSVLLSVDRVNAIKFMLTVVAVSTPIAFYWQNFGREKLLHSMAWFIILMAFVNFAYVLALPAYGMMSGEHAGAWRGMFEHKNAAGPFFAIGFFFILDQLRKGTFRNALVPLGAMAICFLFVPLSKSGTGVVAFLFMGLMYTSLLAILRLSKPLERIALLLGVIGSIIMVYFLAGEVIMGVFFELTGKDATFTGRTNIWAPLMKLSYARPLLGYGLGMAQTPEFMARVHGAIGFDAKSSHSSYIDLMINIGYPGAIIFVLFLLKRFLRALFIQYRYIREIRLASLSASIIAVAMIIGFTSADVFIGRSIFWLYLFIALLLSVNVKPINKPAHP